MYSSDYVRTLNTILDHVIQQSGNKALAATTLEAILAGIQPDTNCQGHITGEIRALVQAVHGCVPMDEIVMDPPKGSVAASLVHYAHTSKEWIAYGLTARERNRPMHEKQLSAKQEPPYVDVSGRYYFRELVANRIKLLRKEYARERRVKEEVSIYAAHTHLNIVEYLAKAEIYDISRQTTSSKTGFGKADIFGILIPAGSALSFLYAGRKYFIEVLTRFFTDFVGPMHGTGIAVLGTVLAPLVYLPIVVLNAPFVTAKLTSLLNPQLFTCSYDYLGYAINIVKHIAIFFTGFNSSVNANDFVTPQLFAHTLMPVCITSSLLGNANVFDNALSPYLVARMNAHANKTGFKASQKSREAFCKQLEEGLQKIRSLNPKDAYEFCVPKLQSSQDSEEFLPSLFADTIAIAGEKKKVGKRYKPTLPPLITNIMSKLFIGIAFFAYITNVKQGTRVANTYNLTGIFAKLSNLCGFFSFLTNGWVARLGWTRTFQLIVSAVSTTVQLLFPTAIKLSLAVMGFKFAFFAFTLALGAIVAIGPYELALKNKPYSLFPDNKVGRWLAEQVPLAYFLTNMLMSVYSVEKFKRIYESKATKFDELPKWEGQSKEKAELNADAAKEKICDILEKSISLMRKAKPEMVNAVQAKVSVYKKQNYSLFANSNKATVQKRSPMITRESLLFTRSTRAA